MENLSNRGIAIAFRIGQQGKESNAKVEICEYCKERPSSRWTRPSLISLRQVAESAEEISVVNPFSRMLVCGAILVAVGVRGADQALQLQHSIADETVIESPADEALALWERFKSAFEERTADSFADRFHPFSSLSWRLRLEDADADQFQERISDGARKALTRSIKHGAREATVDLPLMTWLKDKQGFLADFLRNSMSNVGEESVAPSELSYHVTERSWWDRLSESSRLRYGIRPFRTAPYAFASMGIRDGETVLLLANVRYVFRDFAEHKFELALSLPLPHGLSVDFGAAYQFDRRDAGEHLVFRLFKKLDKGGIFYVGMEMREQPRVLAGLAVAL